MVGEASHQARSDHPPFGAGSTNRTDGPCLVSPNPAGSLSVAAFRLRAARNSSAAVAVALDPPAAFRRFWAARLAQAARPPFRRTKPARPLGPMFSSSAERNTLAFRLTVAGF